MGNYITEAMLSARVGAQALARFVQQEAGSAECSAAATAVITRAEARMDASLAERYAVPVPATGLLEELALAIAEWEVYRRGSGAVPAKIRQAYDDALADLKAIAAGQMGTGSSAVPTLSGAAVGIVVDGAAALFDPDSMEDADW